MFAVLLAMAAAQAAPPGWVPDARFTLALYCPQTCEESTLEAFDASLDEVRPRTWLPRSARYPMRLMGLEETSSWGLPEVDALGSLADALSAEGEQVLNGSQEVVAVTLATPQEYAVEVLRLGYDAMAEVAAASGGVVEEVSTGRLFDADAFADHAEALGQDPFDTSLVYILEPVEDDDGTLSLLSQGLRALGQHELRMTDVAEDRLADMAAVLNGFAQVVYEQGGELDSRMPLSEGDVEHPGVRRVMVGIDGMAISSYASPSLGNTSNPVVEVMFEGRFDAPPLEPLEPEPAAEPALSSKASEPSEPTAADAPSEDPQPAAEGAAATATTESAPSEPESTAKADPGAVTPEAADSESEPPSASPPTAPTLEEALRLSAEALAGPVRERFEKGLAPGTVLFVKAPFETPEGALEYLWIEVKTWEGDQLGGVLRSQPTWRSDLAAGDSVTVSQPAVYDYLLRHPDGTTEGNRTQRFLE